MKSWFLYYFRQRKEKQWESKHTTGTRIRCKHKPQPKCDWGGLREKHHHEKGASTWNSITEATQDGYFTSKVRLQRAGGNSTWWNQNKHQNHAPARLDDVHLAFLWVFVPLKTEDKYLLRQTRTKW